MKTIQQHIGASCAIIEKNGLILVAQRSEAMAMPLKWEFPGGKVEPDESAATCLQREIREELGVEIGIISPVAPSTWSYPDFTITLYPFVCYVSGGVLRLVQEVHKPIFHLTSADGAIGSHANAVEDAKKDSRVLAGKIAERIGMVI